MSPRRTQPPSRLSSAPNSKPGVDSFSFVEGPTTRYVAELPSRPSTPPASSPPPAPVGDAPSALAPTPSGAMAAPPPVQAACLQPNGAPAKLATGSTPPNSLASAPTLQGDARTATAATDGERQPRSSSRSRRRLTASLGSLLSGPKRDKRPSTDGNPSASGAANTASGGAAAAPPVGLQRLRRTSSPSRRATRNGSAGVDSPLDPSPASSVRAPKPPVTLPHLFRRRYSASQGSDAPPPPSGPAPTASSPRAGSSSSATPEPRRPSLDGLVNAQRASHSSDGSLGALTASGSAVSTAPTSPDALVVSEEETATAADRRRQDSLALATHLSREARNDDIEDLRDFVMASGRSSTSPLSTSQPFTRRPSNAALSAGGLSPLFTCDAAPPRVVMTSGNSSPPLHPRRLTRNIEGLSLSDLHRDASSASATPPSILPSRAAAPFASTSTSSPQSSPPSASASRASSSRGHLGALPRLLSSNALATDGSGNAGNDDQEQETEESETDTEADEPSDEDEGDRYATSDEGPITTRSPFVTPAHTPGVGSVHPTPRARTPGAILPRPPVSRLPSLAGLSISTAVGAPSSSTWGTLVAHTPTPGTARTTRAPGGLSYFDLPRPSSSGSVGACGPHVPPKTPLAPMSMSDVARGKRPALQEDVDAAATVSAGSASHEASPRASVASVTAQVPTADASARGGLYRLRSQSVIALASPSMVDEEGGQLGTAGVAGLDPVWQQGVPAGQKTPGFLSFGLAAQQQEDEEREVLQDVAPHLPVTLDHSVSTPPASSQASSPATAIARPTTASPGNRLQRTRSMYELRDAPPAYSSMYRQSGTGAPQVIVPREEEGNEGLPPYSCAIHIEGYMPRKLEFTAPGIQARDRAWKRQYFVLHGTSIKIYRFDLRSHPIPGEEDWSVVPANIAGSDGPPPLHFHEGEYGADQSPHGNRFSIEHAKAKAKDRIIASATASAENALVRHYSLQHAESGLAADYVKRKHVVRVRAEGEQFLLQAKDDRGVIDLIEALQAATNVSLDLDARPLPKFITLPRRRRRRRVRPVDPAVADGATAATNGTGAAGATGARAAETGGRGEDRMGDMLAEEQNSYSQRTSGTVM
ncbi:hypothetical protein JCM3770_006497 [Rhodotorula araucariae]